MGAQNRHPPHNSFRSPVAQTRHTRKHNQCAGLHRAPHVCACAEGDEPVTCEPIITNGTNPRLHGSTLLALDVICPRGTSIPGQYEMFSPQTSPDMLSATFLQALVVGPSPCGLQDTESCPVGQDPHHASHSLLQDSSAEKAMTGTSRQSGLASSKSANLSLFLASRLRRRLGTDGSTIYSMRWKSADTPAGRQYCQLVASARRTSGSACSLAQSGLPTPSGTSGGGKNHVAGRLDEWGGSSNPFRGTSLGKVHCPYFELWMMGFPEAWWALMPRGTPSSRSLRPHSSKNSSAQQPKYQAAINAEHAHV